MSQPQFLLNIFVSVMELSWFYPWLAFLGSILTRQDDALTPVTAFVLFFFVQGVAGLLNRWRIVDLYQRIVVGIFVLLTVLLMIWGQIYPALSFWNLRWIGTSLSHLVRFDPVVSHELFLALATLAIWWRGFRMSQRVLFVDEVGFQFRLGILLLIGLLVFQALGLRRPMTGWVVSLFLCGLLSVTLARVRDGAPTRQDTQWFSLRWLFMLLAGAGGTLLLGLLVNTLLTTETALSRALRPVFDTLKFLFIGLVFVTSYVLIWALSALVQWFFRTFSLDGSGAMETITLSPPALPDFLNVGESATLPAWLDWVEQGVVVLIVVGLFMLFVITVRRWQLRASSGSDVWRESVWSSKEIGQGLLAGLQRNLRELAGLWSGRQGRLVYSAATIRRIYASLLALAERRGFQRPPAETPFEYLPVLARAFPGWDAELRILTRAYVDAHYGRLPDTKAELQALRDVWEHIQHWVDSHPENETID